MLSKKPFPLLYNSGCGMLSYDIADTFSLAREAGPSGFVGTMSKSMFFQVGAKRSPQILVFTMPSVLSPGPGEHKVRPYEVRKKMVRKDGTQGDGTQGDGTQGDGTQGDGKSGLRDGKVG